MICKEGVTKIARYDLDPTFSQRQQADYPRATALKPYQFNRISWLQK